jgi:hypothetical protein
MKKLLGFLLLVAGIVSVTSCKKDSDPNAGIISLLSFGPTGAMPGDTLRFFGTRLDQVSEIQFTGTGASVASSAFISQKPDLILLKVPLQTEQGFVTLKTSGGDIVSKTRFNLKVLPVITTMTMQARPGENLTISGQYLNWVSSVTFANSKQVDTFVSRTISQLVVKVPMDAQSGPLVLSYGGTMPEKLQTKDTLKVALPQATAMSPNPAKHADNITITGTNLDLVMKLTFAGVPTAVTSFVSKSATQLVVKVPAGAQKGRLIFEAASGVQTTTTADLDILIPVLTAMTPNPVDPGGRLTLAGTNLDLVSSVIFSNAPAVTSFISQSASQIVVMVPMGVLKGKITLGVLNSTVIVQSSDILDITGSAPDPTISLPIYKDAVTSNWNGWIGGGWGGTSDRDNASPVREGAKSIKIDYVGGFGSPLQLGGATVNVTGYTTFKISVFGAPGSADKKINIGINGADSPYTITVVEGKWTDYEIPLSTLSLSAANPLKELWVKEASGTGGFSVFVDAIGLN